MASTTFEETKASLGDELRAARSARGLSISDVEADLRIRSHYIEAIEAGDLSSLPDKVYVDGFLRNYAVYLDIEADDVVRRFNAETVGTPAKSSSLLKSKSKPTNDPLAGFSAKPSSRSRAGGFLNGVVSLWPLVAVIALGAGIWFAVQAARDAGMIPENLSLIGEAETLEPVFEANISDEGDGINETIERPADLSYAKLGTPPYWNAEEEEEAADGPLSAIDIDTVGLFQTKPTMPSVFNQPTALPAPFARRPLDPVEDIAAQTRAALSMPADAPLATEQNIETIAADIAQADLPVVDAKEFALVATDETWIEIKAVSGAVRFSGILASGESYDIPDEDGLSLKVGNAGGLSIEIAGQTFGPFGRSGAVMRRIALERTDLERRFADVPSETSVQ